MEKVCIFCGLNLTLKNDSTRKYIIVDVRIAVTIK